jgi:hypothetical protein
MENDSREDLTPDEEWKLDTFSLRGKVNDYVLPQMSCAIIRKHRAQQLVPLVKLLEQMYETSASLYSKKQKRNNLARSIRESKTE